MNPILEHRLCYQETESRYSIAEKWNLLLDGSPEKRKPIHSAYAGKPGISFSDRE
jgi:hypothetical protein